MNHLVEFAKFKLTIKHSPYLRVDQVAQVVQVDL